MTTQSIAETALPTIYALASGHGKAGVAVFRISGPNAASVLPALGHTAPLSPRMASLVTLRQPTGAMLDQALALFFPGPHSFTGEDVLELHTHGSRAVIDLLLATLAALPGLRLAEPGEFARRAYSNAKFDLLAAEGLGDLIDAETPAQHTQALRQLSGDSSRTLEALRESILNPLALLEAYIDFPDEDIPEATLQEVKQQVGALQAELVRYLADGSVGELIRDGLEIVILGPPNAGKSSLLNALARREAAIVSETAGTTRDLIEVHLNLDGYAAILVDTAGLREADGVEGEGIRRARERAARASLKLLVLDINSAAQQYRDFQALHDESTLLVWNKSDEGTLPPSLPAGLVISTRTGAGIAALTDALRQAIHARVDAAPTPLITRARHREAFARAHEALQRFSPDTPLEFMCEELRVAAQALGKITGKIAPDDLLDVVFRRFCIGK